MFHDCTSIIIWFCVTIRHQHFMYIIYCVTIRHQHCMFHGCTSSHDSVWPSDTNISCSMTVHHHIMLYDHQTPTFWVPCLCINIWYYVTIQHQHFMFHGCTSTYDIVWPYIIIWYCVPITPTFCVPRLYNNIGYCVTIRHHNCFFLQQCLIMQYCVTIAQFTRILPFFVCIHLLWR